MSEKTLSSAAPADADYGDLLEALGTPIEEGRRNRSTAFSKRGAKMLFAGSGCGGGPGLPLVTRVAAGPIVPCGNFTTCGDDRDAD